MTTGYHLLGVGQDAKTVKGQGKGYLTGILYMAPYTMSGFNVCPMASPGCIASCLNSAGRGAFNSVQAARKRKTLHYFNDRVDFIAKLVADCKRLERSAAKHGLKPVVRLNGTSDILWERVAITGQMVDGEGRELRHVNIMAMFPGIVFYDYTKQHPGKRFNNQPSNYTLVFSLDERPESEERAKLALELGWPVAVVFATTNYAAMPKTFLGAPVVDGDEDDLRFLTAAASIVGLKAKGKAKGDTTGFVRPVTTH